jgi:hypothetical protein
MNQKGIVEYRELVARDMQLTNLKPKKGEKKVNCKKN